MAEAQRRRRLATLEEYLSSLAAGNPAWRHKAMQKNDTFIGRLEREDCRGRSEGVHCRPAPSQAPDSGASAPPVQLLWSPEEGRHLVASRDIAAGEDIFREPPLVLTPRPHPEPVCLACLAPLKADWSGCEGCGAPLCSPPCDGELHVVSECGMLAGLGLQQDRDQLLPLNQLLTTTRTLLLLQEAPQAGHVIEAMQSNVEKRQRSVVAQAMEKRVMEGLRRLGMEEEEGVVRHICGVFDTNAFAVDGGRALLPLAALMNHHCSANTQHWFHRGTLVVRAARNIPKGEAITNTYTPVLWGNRARAAYLASSKLFTCRCERCLDPRELGSHLSSVRCRQCQGGVLLPPSSPAETVWQCESCGENVAAAAVEAMVRAAATMAKGAVGDAEELQAVVCQMTRLVGECHYVTVGAKHSLVETIMAGRLHDVSGADLRRVVDLCGDLLHIADLLEPGLSRLRGVLLLEQVRAAAELLRRQTAADFSAISSVTDTEETTATITSTSTSTAFDITCDESAPSQLSLIQYSFYSF
ncbi:SET domain-containing protein SmydA-8-like isoform X2 [Portunus trituberculatus]|uniref:SET domain-containing protein SmydA-8-like isoform X2 n=1 Tax=Portunus trituberculatus TaxID=210409 RepID=UPI001E1CC485|nr:SET domain-containing protein SmydA-8-like isoform X2 [Portunus trituberculatus]